MSWNNDKSTWEAGTANDNSNWGGGDAVNADWGWDSGRATNNSDQNNNTWDNANGPDSGDTHGNDAGNTSSGRACFKCGKFGHKKVDCPSRPVPNSPCCTCGEEGHRSRECPTAPPLQCKECQSTEHLVKNCPNRICKNCSETGHTITQCKNPRKIDRSNLSDMEIEEAWTRIKRAVQERDIDDIKEAVQIYVKTSPKTTYADLERAFRAQGVALWLIAIEKALAPAFVNMDLQGNLGKKFTVTYRFQWSPSRPRDREVWPKDVDENLERLADAGEVVYGGLPKCSNCDEIGHVAKSCPQDKVEKPNSFEITCFNCGEKGHRVRDCPTPRVDKFACKNCGQSGHKVADCTQPRSAETVECRKCGEMGHFSRDCPQGSGNYACRNCGQEGHIARNCTEEHNLAMIQCRNCDELGHKNKDCPKPRNMSRVKCNNCKQMGHYKSLCINPFVPDEADDGGYGGGDSHNFGAAEDPNFHNNDTSAANVSIGGADDW